jgi:hypothetical protein
VPNTPSRVAFSVPLRSNGSAGEAARHLGTPLGTEKRVQGRVFAAARPLQLRIACSNACASIDAKQARCE